MRSCAFVGTSITVRDPDTATREMREKRVDDVQTVQPQFSQTRGVEKFWGDPDDSGFQLELTSFNGSRIAEDSLKEAGSGHELFLAGLLSSERA